jgi:predicted CXXCH cytochrome family protein
MKSLLLAQSPDLCFSCHKQVKEQMKKQKVHAPAEDCLTCHQPHAAAQPRLVSQPVHELCGQCHDPSAKPFAAAHLGIDAKAIACMGCHDPHASTDPKFFKAKQHVPFASRDCDTCHVTEKKK